MNMRALFRSRICPTLAAAIAIASTLIGVAVQASDGLHAAHGSATAFPWRGVGIVKFAGPVDQSMVDTLKTSLDALPPSVRELELSFDSPGGENRAGNQIIEILRELKRNGRHFTARVNNGSVCASMCLPIYLQADERLAGPAASFMFHAVHLGFGYGGVTRPEQTQSYLDFFRGAGVSPEWLAQAQKDGVFDSPQPSWYNGRELLEENSGIVKTALPRKEEMRSISIFGQTIWF